VRLSYLSCDVILCTGEGGVEEWEHNMVHCFDFISHSAFWYSKTRSDKSYGTEINGNGSCVY